MARPVCLLRHSILCSRYVWSEFRQYSTGKNVLQMKLGRPLCNFGLLLDVDGVLTRGKEVLPGVKQAFKYFLTDKDGNFRVPVVFVTNAGNMLRSKKSDELSEKLGVTVHAHQVLLSHSPLRMFRQFHDRHVLVVGQGPILEIARNLGFTHVTTIDDLRSIYPYLDCVDHSRRRVAPESCTQYLAPIEAVVLFGEPVRWETSFQLLLDVLTTNGQPRQIERGVQHPHIPVLACNMDLLFMAETNLPRIGHGIFLLALEEIYKKVSGKELKYEALMGKPNSLTYHHSEFCIKQQAQALGIPMVKNLYAIGDNPESDILGANLFQQYLSQRNLQKQLKEESNKEEMKLSAEGSLGRRVQPVDFSWENFDDEVEFDNGDPLVADHGAANCYSVLVETGVYSSACGMNGIIAQAHLGELARNTVLRTPNFVKKDLLDAVTYIFERENFDVK